MDLPVLGQIVVDHISQLFVVSHPVNRAKRKQRHAVQAVGDLRGRRIFQVRETTQEITCQHQVRLEDSGQAQAVADAVGSFYRITAEPDKVDEGE